MSMTRSSTTNSKTGQDTPLESDNEDFLDIADLLSMSYVKPSSTTNSTIVQDLIRSDSIAERSYCDKLDDKITNSFPLWVYKNSMKDDNKCTYIVCSGCYGENREKGRGIE